jgi:hypothetical protein
MKDIQVKISAKCEICRGGHETIDCHVGPSEELNYVQSYNSGWQSIGDPKSEISELIKKNEENQARTNKLLETIVMQRETRYQEQQKKNQEFELLFRNQGSTLQSLERVIGELVGKMTRNSTDVQVNAVFTESGKSTGVDNPVSRESEVVEEESVDEEIRVDSPGKVHPTRLDPASTAQPKSRLKEKQSEGEPKKVYVPPAPYEPVPPYPGRLNKSENLEQYRPFINVRRDMPKYGKFLREMLSRKEKLKELSQVTLSEEFLAVVLNKLPEKMTDPGSFTIPCQIGGLTVRNALADLGASINLMPYSMFKKIRSWGVESN